MVAHKKPLSLVESMPVKPAARSRDAKVTLPRREARRPAAPTEHDAVGLEHVLVNVRNIQEFTAQPPRKFTAILFDPINNCNIHCAYCHVPRSAERVEDEMFARFLSSSIIGTRRFQFGCGMEPTMDPRLADLMMMVARSPARPRDAFRLQTNGILLHRHDWGKLREAGLTVLSVSIDTIDPASFARLRGGTSLPKVLRNLQKFRAACPDIEVVFVTTVTSLNIDTIDELLSYGIDLGVTHFNLRQVFHMPWSIVVDHARMQDLVVSDAAFEEMSGRTRAKFGHLAQLRIQTVASMTAQRDVVRKASLFPPAGKERIETQQQE
jgi:molybdenum cofactor biosynthesis enzyme MoaA